MTSARSTTNFFSFLSRRTLIVLAVLAILGLAHAPILRLLARPLLTPELPTEADFYCLHGAEMGVDGFGPFAHAQAWYEEAPGRKILLLLPPDSRTVEIGAVRSFEQACRSELGKRGVPPSAVVAIRAEVGHAWGGPCALAGWLQEHPGATVVLACSPFGTGRERYVLDRVIGPADAGRVRLALLADPDGTTERWWRSRRGVKDFMYAWLDLIYTWVEGDAPRTLPVPAAEFRRAIREQIGKATP